MISGLSTLWRYVYDMDASVAFYRDVLGLEPGVMSPYWSDFKLGDQRIGLHPGGKGEVPSVGWCLGLASDDLKALKQRLADHGIAITADYHQTPSGVVLSFNDSEGYPIQVIQPGSKLSDFN
ncbi:MAG: VOC family protein [Armatimonadetes bacterium]|nr:VOC family protein [Armatimonadota bacterium]